MSVSSKTRLRMASASLVLAAALPALAQTQAPAAKPPVQAAPAAALSQVVTRDATSGELRAATTDEVNALQSKAARRATATQPVLRSHVSGAQGAQLPEEFMTYSVVVRGADGKLVTQEFTGKAAAEAAVKSPAIAAKPATAPTE